ncbi:MAG: formate dehydrogenase accessory sulfurtransferase FdhD [Planctomycetota bacterium]
MNDPYEAPERSVEILRYSGDVPRIVQDVVATEEPLEIRVVFDSSSADRPQEVKRRSKSVAVTMRTPGHDAELAIGFLISEGIVSSKEDIQSISRVGPPPEQTDHGNTVVVSLASGIQFDESKLQRNFFTTSSCGICGKASIEAVRAQGMVRAEHKFTVGPRFISGLPDLLRSGQSAFETTGGIHAAGLFDQTGNCFGIREDVGRHNAVDKLYGGLVQSNFDLKRLEVPLFLVVSGRASFELVQKAVMGSTPMMVAVGAPSSLAVELANEFNITLIGFTSSQRFNCYSGRQRLDFTENDDSQIDSN